MWQIEGAGQVLGRAQFAGRPTVLTNLTASVAPGAAGSASVTLTAPPTAGATAVVLDLLTAGSSEPFATVTANTEVAPALQGTVTTAAAGAATGVPPLWTRGQPKTFTVQVSNTALSDGTAWVNSGGGRILVRARFGGASPLPYQYVDLAGGVTPGASGLSGSITLTAPAAAGTYPVELALLPTGTASVFATASVTVTVRDGFAASVSSSGVPTSWGASQTQTFNVTVTNVGAATWNATGANPVVLVAKFVNGTTGAQLAAAVTVGLASDVAPDGSAALAVTLTAPDSLAGVELDFQLLRQGASSIPTNLRVPVTAAP